MNDLEFDLSRPLKVKSNVAVGLLIYEILMSDINHMPISHRLSVIYLLSLCPNF